jgi:3-methyladenine DNA glycosylase AlkD
VRLVALFILVYKYRKSKTEREKKKIYNFYLKQTDYINNWDLVDLSASYVVGGYLIDKDKKVLEKLAHSKKIWERRIAMIATFAFIYQGDSEWTFKIARILLKDEHDLIQKAVGWMLREVGKRISEIKLEKFLQANIKTISRTTLRYAIERFPESKRQHYLKLR